MNGVRWVCVTIIGSPYAAQMEVYSGKKRYRHIRLGGATPFGEKGIGPWVYGDPPQA